MIIHQFTETGEVRKPKKGEYYSYDIKDRELLGKATVDFKECEVPIFTYERIEKEWEPGKHENFFFITDDGLIEKEYCVDSDWEDRLLNYGNCFPTKELAEPYRDIIELVYKCSPEKLKQIKDILKGD